MKTAIITGGNEGIGLEITRVVAKAGFHVIMACRNIEKAEIRREGILSENREASIEVLYLDLSDLNNICSFCSLIAEKFHCIDLLMNNAGMIPTCSGQNLYGLEQAVCVNYVGPYLLTRQLIPLMPEGARIVNMISSTYVAGQLSLPEFFHRGRKGDFRRLSVYSNTKLAMMLFTFELARRLKPDRITVNAADPGIVSTNMITMEKWFDPLANIFFRPFIKSPRKGAITPVKLLLDETCAGVSGQVYAGGKIRNIPSKYRNHPMQQQLWTDTGKLVSKYLD